MELNKGFNLSYLTLKTDAFKKRSVLLKVTEEVFLACTISYFTQEQGRKSKIGQYQIKERKMCYSLIYETLKYDMIPRMPDYLKIGSSNIHTARCEFDSESKLITTPPTQSLSGPVPS